MRNISFLIKYLLIIIVLINPLNVLAVCDISIGNVDVCPEPPLLQLPAAGVAFVDPTFGTTIIRVTDRNDGQLNFHAYSFWSPFNSDSTRFVINKSGNDADTYLYSFNPNTLTITDLGRLFTSMNLHFDGLCWDSNDPSIIYGLQNKKLYSMNVGTKVQTLLKDFSSNFTDQLYFLTKSDDDRWFAFMVGPQDNNNGIVGAWDTQTDTVYYYNFNANYGLKNIHNALIDKSGKYVTVAFSDANLGHYLWSITAGTVQYLPKNNTVRSLGHRALGNQFSYHADIWHGGSIIKRDLNNAQNWTHIFEVLGGEDWSQDAHFSLNHKNESYIFTERYFTSVPYTITRPYQQEIVQVWADGSSMTKTRRLAHHRSTYTNYYSTPKAASSIDGNFIMFESNWGNTAGGIDVFILKVPPLSGGDTVTPSFPTNLKFK